MEKFFEKKNQWVILILAGLLLVVIAIPSGSGTGQNQAETTGSAVQQTEEADEVERLEERLEAALSKVEGVGKTKVMITMEATGEKIVEKDQQSSSRTTQENGGDGDSGSSQDADSSQSTVYERTQDGSEIPYVTQETALKIRGVLVVAEGGSNPVIVQNITEAVMALFGVEAHKIKVMKMS
ncbi:MAG: stage III sporulation protein AG [Eubacteriales bacterium]|nr:stage III sporulation protein AG [Eubacteriales bacterium]